MLITLIKDKFSGQSFVKWVDIFNQALQKNKYYTVIMGVVGFCVFFAVYTSLAMHYRGKEMQLTSTQNKQSEAILRELNETNSMLQKMRENPANSRTQQRALEILEKDVLAVKRSIIEVAKNSDLQKVSNQIVLIKEDVDLQFEDLKKLISADADKKQYLDANFLPFQIIAVDIIAGQSYVSIDYHNQIFPLGIGDLLAGWRVVAVNHEQGEAEFINIKNQYVKINLRGG